MELTAKSRPNGSIPFHANTPSFRSEAEAEIMLNTFEAELDSLLTLVSEDRKAASSEALIRRYATAEKIYENLDESVRRVQLKMMMLSDRIAEGFSGRNVLEGAGEPTQKDSGK